MNIKRVYRLYKLEGLEVRTKKRRKRASHLRVVPPAPAAANERWSMDFMRDTFDDGRPFRILTVVDTFTRERRGRKASSVDRSDGSSALKTCSRSSATNACQACRKAANPSPDPLCGAQAGGDQVVRHRSYARHREVGASRFDMPELEVAISKSVRRVPQEQPLGNPG